MWDSAALHVEALPHVWDSVASSQQRYRVVVDWGPRYDASQDWGVWPVARTMATVDVAALSNL